MWVCSRKSNPTCTILCFFGHSTELHECAFQPIEPAFLSFAVEGPDVMPARRAERGDKQIRADLAPADLDQALAKIDLQLLTRRRLNRIVARPSAASSCRYRAPPVQPCAG